MKTPERRQWLRSGVFIVSFEHFTPYSSGSIVNFEHVIAGWGFERKDLMINLGKNGVLPQESP